MSRIIFEENCTPLSMYSEILQNKIDSILGKIGISDEGITWIICTEDYLKSEHFKKEQFPLIFQYVMPPRYGRCSWKKEGGKIQNTIGISTAALHAEWKNTNSFTRIWFIRKKKRDLLADVIMDELAHIITRKHHKTQIYNDTLKKYHEKYYDL